mgnify:FL=1
MSPHLQNRIIAKSEYETFRVILRDSKLIKCPQYVSQSFKISLSHVNAVIDEFNESGCVIIQSKMNYGKS